MLKKKTLNVVWATIVAVAVSFIFIIEEKEDRKQSLTIETSASNYWHMFADISLERKYIEEAEAYYRLPIFTPELLALAGKEITLTGYYLPFSRVDSVIIISRFPNASCFFCGQAGVESVAMVELTKVKSYRTDQMLSVTGRLQLNATDVKKLAFVVQGAEVEEL